MTSRQRFVLAAVAALVVVAAVVAGAAWSHDGRRLGVEGGVAERASTRESTSSTYALVPVTGGTALPPTTAAPPPKPPRPPEATVPTSTTAAPADASASPVLTAGGALLTRPAGAPPRAIDKAKGCRSANDAGWSIVDCGALKTQGMVLVWVVEQRGAGLRALVLREQGANQWVPALAAADDSGTAFSRIGVRGDDVSGDGQPDLLFGFHRRDAASTLALDVVEAPGNVTLHRDAPGGAARTSSGQLDTFSMTAGGSTAQHDVIRRVANEWRVAFSETVARDAVPPSVV
ncbi:MAG TPA: hypothetical protein VHN98_05150 [Acidimicrobiales bacterium]|nr:hypothetical protein [Acidimicrobiales bacterium]